LFSLKSSLFQGGFFLAALLLFIRLDGIEGNLPAANVDLTRILEGPIKERLLEKIGVWLLSCHPDKISYQLIN
jgi:hypothetical protein